MKKILSLILCLLLMVGMLAGCARQDVQSSDQITLNIYNWGQ